jgi:hypothetical protein
MIKHLFTPALLASLLLTACSPALLPAAPATRLQAQSASAEPELLARMLRQLFKTHFADDVDNGQSAETVPQPRGGLVFEGMSRAWLLRAAVYPLSDRIIKKEFNKPSQPDQLPRIDEAGIQELMRRIQPGDIVLSGNNNSFVHAFVYPGQDQIIHALAQLTPTGEFMGVIQERLTGYLRRVHRDKLVVLRRPGLSAQDLSRMHSYLKAQIGKSYDSLFLHRSEDRFYCTELTWKALQQTDHPPRVYPHKAGYGWDLLKNEDFMDSPDLETVWTFQYTRPPVGQRHSYR